MEGYRSLEAENHVGNPKNGICLRARISHIILHELWNADCSKQDAFPGNCCFGSNLGSSCNSVLAVQPLLSMREKVVEEEKTPLSRFNPSW